MYNFGFVLAGALAWLPLSLDAATGQSFDLARITADLFTNDRDLRQPRVLERLPGVVIGEYRNGGDLARATRFAHLFNTVGSAFSIRVQHGVGTIAAPAFNGVLLESGRPIANLKILEIDSRFPGDIKGAVVGALARIDRFSEREAWVDWQMKRTRALAGRSDEADEFVLEARQLKHYRARLAAVRQLKNLFAPGSRRPTWILVDAKDAKPLSRSLNRYLAHLTKKSTHVPVIMVLQRERLTTFAGDDFSRVRLSGCDLGLIGAKPEGHAND